MERDGEKYLSFKVP